MAEAIAWAKQPGQGAAFLVVQSWPVLRDALLPDLRDEGFEVPRSGGAADFGDRRLFLRSLGRDPMESYQGCLVDAAFIAAEGVPAAIVAEIKRRVRLRVGGPVFAGGTVEYRCRRCSVTFDGVHVPSLLIATVELASSGRVRSWSGIPCNIVSTHACADGGEGLADCIGGRRDLPERVEAGP